MVALIALAFALFGVVLYHMRLSRIAEAAPRLDQERMDGAAALGTTSMPLGVSASTVTVIIPAYNEAVNLEDCVLSVLHSTDWTAERLTVWVVDDQSSDGTLAIAQDLQTRLADPRFHVLAGQPRPTGETWMGKNWACAQVVDLVTGDFLLFLDADVRLKPGAIATAIHRAEAENSDLLTVCPEIVCGCLAEWLIQPLMAGLLLGGFDFAAVNNPDTDTAFAFGPFMLFRRSAYVQLGGHRAVANQVVEDVELARRIKQMRFKLTYGLGHGLASVRMYRSFAAVWEGWTKNWHLGSRRNVWLSLYSAAIVLWVCALPWLGAVWLILQGLGAGLPVTVLADAGLAGASSSWFNGIAAGIALVAIGFQFRLRQAIAKLSGIPTDYWWLTGVGGILVAAIAVTSIIKTETGWGWTWRGRSLKLPGDLP